MHRVGPEKMAFSLRGTGLYALAGRSTALRPIFFHVRMLTSRASVS
jgi:hypothetical protein